jgi:hydroxymethylpyrimidine kinase / phosphomethylpyrimidine kinase / thiamine-phosphate diphosphorylase
MRPVVLVIAGSDSSGGAGIQADLKALDHIGVHGASAITCVTSQNSTEVRSLYPLAPGAVLDQASEVLSDMHIEVVKCGMLYSEPIIRAVADLIEDRRLRAVVDPVLIATSGGRLAQEGGAAAYMRYLVPRAWAVTPNAHEAEALLGTRVNDAGSASRAARRLVAAGAKAAVVKGGHLSGPKGVTDTLAVEGARGQVRVARETAPRVAGQFHGAGCHFASFMAGFAARGLPPERAFALAHGVLQQTIRGRERLGAGPYFLATPAQRFVVEQGASTQRAQIAWALAASVIDLCAVLPRTAVPEVGTNFGFAVPRAKSPEDVCAVDGRIVVSKGRAVAAGPIRFGASRHVARILLTLARVAPQARSVCNLRYSQGALRKARAARLSVATFDRALEPAGRRGQVKTMSWGTAQAVEALARTPDLIADTGAIGKEPMIRVLGRDPAEVVRKVKRVLGT